MKLLVNRDYNLGQEEIQHFEKGKVYEVEAKLAARLLASHGPGSPWVRDGADPVFEEVGERRHAAAVVTVGGAPETGASGEVDHAHMSDSELQHIDKKAQERVLSTDLVAKQERETAKDRAEAAKANTEAETERQKQADAELKTQGRPGDTVVGSISQKDASPEADPKTPTPARPARVTPPAEGSHTHAGQDQGSEDSMEVKL